MTPPVAVMPDAVAVVLDYLRQSPRVTGCVNLGADRLSSRFPAVSEFPWVTVQRIGGAMSVRQRLDRARLQVDTWGDPDPTAAGEQIASLLARTVRAQLLSAAGWVHPDGVLCAVDEESGPQWLPDSSRTPATPRFTFTVAASIHPHTTT